MIFTRIRRLLTPDIQWQWQLMASEPRDFRSNQHETRTRRVFVPCLVLWRMRPRYHNTPTFISEPCRTGYDVVEACRAQSVLGPPPPYPPILHKRHIGRRGTFLSDWARHGASRSRSEGSRMGLVILTHLQTCPCLFRGLLPRLIWDDDH